MPRIGYNGFEYDVPLQDTYTNREMIELERVSGHTFSDIAEMFEKGRIAWAVLVATAWISVQRAGAKVTLNELLDAQLDAISWIGDTVPEEAADSPPAEVSDDPVTGIGGDDDATPVTLETSGNRP